jgi:penicillin-binding protein 2
LKAVLTDPSKPLLNRCIADRFPLGSVMKPFIAAVALEEGVISPTDTFVCHGSLRVGRRTFACDGCRPHGRVNVVEALRRSCNCFFYRLGMRLGLKRIAPYARAVGFGRLVGIDVFGERPGVFPDPQDPGHWTQGDDCLLAIGQGRMAVTPLQATCMMAEVANGGSPVTPRLGLHAPTRLRAARIFSSSSLGVVRQGLEEVVRVGTPGQRGTAHSAFHRGGDPLNVGVAGKTGTADTGSGNRNVQPHAWFAGYVPAKNPQVAFCVFVQNGGHGGDVAAPIAYRVLRRIYGTRSRPASAWRGEARAEAVSVR